MNYNFQVLLIHFLKIICLMQNFTYAGSKEQRHCIQIVFKFYAYWPENYADYLSPLQIIVTSKCIWNALWGMNAKIYIEFNRFKVEQRVILNNKINYWVECFCFNVRGTLLYNVVHWPKGSFTNYVYKRRG